MQRQTWSSASLVEDSNVYRLRLLKSPCFVIQRQLSPMRCSDQHGRPYPLSKAQCLSTETTKVSPFCHPEASEPDDTQRPTWSFAPFVEGSMSIGQDCWSLPFSSSRDNQVRWHAVTNMVVCPLWLKTQCLSTETIIVHPLSSRDNRVWWHAKTVMVTRFRCSKTIKVPLLSKDKQVRWCAGTMMVVRF